MADFDLLLEAERRGILPQDKQDLLTEARSRGLAPPPIAHPQSAAPSAAPAASTSPAIPDDDAFTITMGGAPITPGQSAGILRGLAQGAFVDAPQGIGQLTAHGAAWLAQHLAGPQTAAMAQEHAKNIDAYIAQEQAAYEKAQRESGIPAGGDVGNWVGAALSPVNWLTAEAVAPAQGASALSRLFRAGTAGGLIGAEQPVIGANDYGSEKAGQAGYGALFGLGAETAASTVAPWMTAQAQNLFNRYGIRVPFLSSLGRNAGRVEQISQSVPLSGMAVRGQFNQANEDLVRAAYNETLDPIREHGFGGPRYTPESATEPGRQMSQEAHKAVEDSYESVIPRLQSVLDPQFNADVAAARARVPERVRGDFDDALQRNIYDYAELGNPGTAPTRPSTFKSGQPSPPPGWEINLTLGKTGTPGEIAATGKLTKPAALPAQPVGLDLARAQTHVNNFQGAGADPDQFQAAMKYLNGDKGVRKGELQKIYEGYTGKSPGTTLTRQNMMDAIEQEFKSRQTASPFMLNGQNAKNADMGLRDESRNLIQSPGSDLYQRNVGMALRDVRDALRDAWERHSAPEAIEHLRATDLAYRRLMILDRASTSSAAPEGVFGPTQLWSAVKANDPTLGKRATAQGVAELQDLAESAKNVLGKTVADSGTPERGAAMWAARELGPAVALGGAAMSHALPVIGGIGAHAAAYTNPAQAALRMLASGAPEARTGLAGFLRSITPGATGLATSPYDNKPKSVRQWREEAAKQAQGGG